MLSEAVAGTPAEMGIGGSEPFVPDALDVGVTVSVSAGLGVLVSIGVRERVAVLVVETDGVGDVASVGVTVERRVKVGDGVAGVSTGVIASVLVIVTVGGAWVATPVGGRVGVMVTSAAGRPAKP